MDSSIDLSSYDDGSIIELGVTDDDDDCVSEAAEFVLDSWDSLYPVLGLDNHLPSIGNNVLRRQYSSLDMTSGSLMSLSPLRWSGGFNGTNNMVADILSRRDFTDATQISMMGAPHINYDIVDIGFPHWFAGGIDRHHFQPTLSRRGPRRIWGEDDYVEDDMDVSFVLHGQIINIRIVMMRFIDDIITTVSVVNGKFLFLLFNRVILFLCDDDLIIARV